ncbi:unnamed protein product [Hyaloperonospora brassicae]|uniref:Uncharacterized protein n=1 Tax=Hyaloperonospora brassicae TaxID=162125 RepID=A0AAV0TJF8_HYABA|nr:unnamed protein product [Hyaloperonospora brassicae]
MATNRPTDFAVDEDPASPRAFDRVGTALGATFALSFTEACLSIERRPIPLRFALQFAALNVLPSAVWSSVSARHVAAASNVAISALVQDNAERTGSRLSSVGKRLVLAKSVRALRMITGSYGVVWSLWSSGWTIERQYNKREGSKDTEKVLRIAPVTSALSRIARQKHADHIVTVPLVEKGRKIEQAENSVDWNTVGLNVTTVQATQRKRVKVLEVEIANEAQLESTIASVQSLQAQVLKNGRSPSICSVAVLPYSGQVIPSSRMATFDVHYNPMSAALTFIAAVCHARGETHVVVVADDEQNGKSRGRNGEDTVDDAAEVSSHFVSPAHLATGLLYRHGLLARVCSHTDMDRLDAIDSGLVVVLGQSLSAGHASMRKLVEQDGIRAQDVLHRPPCYVIEESLTRESVLSDECQARSALLETTGQLQEELEGESDETLTQPTYFSIADVSDQTLQGIRELLRRGETPNAIQAALYRVYGTQRVVAPQRLDQYSNMNV